MEKLKNIPTLRFPEFDGEWEIKQLGEIGEINPSNKNLPNKFIYIDLESVENGQLLKENEVLKNEAPSRAQRILVKNDILFQMVRPYQMNNLFFDKEGVFVASTGYAQIRTESNPRFLYQYLHLQKFVDKVIERCTGTSYPSINSTDLSKISISLPEFTEQNKIASFLTVVDDKLQALKQKKTLLEQHKKGLMQKIFSQELRFKDDNGNEYPDWEEKKLNEVANKKSSNISANKIEDNFGDYIIYGASGILKKVDFYKEEDDYISIIKDGAGVGRLLYCKGQSSVIGTMEIIRPNEGIDTYYLYCLLSNIDFVKYVTGSTIPHIYFKDYSSEICGLPCLEEQNKIAFFLTAIDDKINNCQSQIEKTEVWKKGLLQKMFC
jgi:type I restriction enzyme S subunit